MTTTLKKVLPLAVFIISFILLGMMMVMPASASAKTHDDDHHGHQWGKNAHGLFTIQFDSEICDLLPKGIAKKFLVCVENNNDDDDEDNDDDTAPTISNISVTNIEEDSARVRFTTNETTKASIYYSEDSGFKTDDDGVVKINSSKKTSHKVLLSNLDEDTTYYFTVTVTDNAGNKKVSTERSFTTDDEDDSSDDDDSDEGAPKISDVMITKNTLAKTAAISWNTNEKADAKVQYGTDEDVSGTGIVTLENDLMTSHHVVILTNLSVNTKYYFKVSSEDASGNVKTSSIHNFQF